MLTQRCRLVDLQRGRRVGQGHLPRRTPQFRCCAIVLESRGPGRRSSRPESVAGLELPMKRAATSRAFWIDARSSGVAAPANARSISRSSHRVSSSSASMGCSLPSFIWLPVGVAHMTRSSAKKPHSPSAEFFAQSPERARQLVFHALDRDSHGLRHLRVAQAGAPPQFHDEARPLRQSVDRRRESLLHLLLVQERIRLVQATGEARGGRPVARAARASSSTACRRSALSARLRAEANRYARSVVRTSRRARSIQRSANSSCTRSSASGARSDDARHERNQWARASRERAPRRRRCRQRGFAQTRSSGSTEGRSLG